MKPPILLKHCAQSENQNDPSLRTLFKHDFSSRPASYNCLHSSYLPRVTNQIITIFHKDKKRVLDPT